MNKPTVPKPPAWLTGAVVAHRIAGLVAIPFLLISIAIAVSLTHTKLVLALSEAIYPSQSIPQVTLDEPIRPGSWDQALHLAALAAGAEARVVSMRDADVIAVSAFDAHSHDPDAVAVNPQKQYLIDTRQMRIVRAEDRTTSLFSQAHGVHAFRFFGVEWASVAFVTSVALLLLLVTGAAIGWHARRAAKPYAPVSRWHLRIGQATALLTVVVVVTTLDFEFNFLTRERGTSHPVPAVALDETVRPGSVDQARTLVARAIGAEPRSVFIQGPDRLKFSEEGDGIGGKSVWVNPQTMTISRITDWRNDSRTLSFIIHDGRWLGGMNAFNINDAVALGLLFLTMTGPVIYLAKKKIKTGSAEANGGGTP